MPKYKLLTLHSLPFCLGIVLSYLFWQEPWILLYAYLALSAVVIWFGRDRRTELFIFLYGLAAGFIIETLGTQISGYQSFTLPQVLGIPYWLIVAWGYGFLLMKRVGFILGTGSPWVTQGER